jgi:glucans biosynthesis protein C
VKKEAGHLYFIDNLKIALIILVIIHHAGQAYGPGGWWYFQEGETIDWLKRFFSVNAAFFMSLFFFLSAYFLPRSIERKGSKQFLVERFNRLGIPLILGFVIMIPTLMYLYYLNFREYETISFPTYYLQIFFGLGDEPANWTGPSWPDMQFGHLWFLEHLLVYAVVLAVWYYIKPRKTLGVKNEKIKSYQIFSFWFIVSMITFFVRIKYPIDHWIGVLGFIQTEMAHVPQYIGFFILGIMAYNKRWFLTISSKTGYLWLLLGGMIILMMYIGGDFLAPYLLKGGANLGSLARSFIETLLCNSLVIGSLVLFREKLNVTSPTLKALSNNVFVVYFIHVPVVVAIQYNITFLPVSVWSKFILTSVLGVIVSFALAQYVWRKTPFLRKMM